MDDLKRKYINTTALKNIILDGNNIISDIITTLILYDFSSIYAVIQSSYVKECKKTHETESHYQSKYL